MQKISSGLVSIGLLLLILVLTSCKVFEPRKSEDPVNETQWNTFQTSPQQVIENLTYAHNYKQNMYRYTNLFSENFKFYFDSQDISDFGFPVSWNKSMEIEVLTNYFNSIPVDSASVLVLTPIEADPDQIQNNQATIYRDYDLRAGHDMANVGHHISGKFTLYLEKDSNGIWRIKQWWDYKKNSDWTWGRLKYEFSSI